MRCGGIYRGVGEVCWGVGRGMGVFENVGGGRLLGKCVGV